MRCLIREELWKRVEKQQGKTVYTIQMGQPNYVQQVTGSKVLLTRDGKPRPSQPTEELVWSTYCYGCGSGRVTGDDFKEGMVSGNPIGKRVSRIILALLACAVPEQIETFKQGQDSSTNLSGIRFKKCD